MLVTSGTAAVGGKLEIVLVGASGKTLYYHTPDRVGLVTCIDATECADNWPPLKLPSKSLQGGGGNPSRWHAGHRHEPQRGSPGDLQRLAPLQVRE